MPTDTIHEVTYLSNAPHGPEETRIVVPAWDEAQARGRLLRAVLPFCTAHPYGFYFTTRSPERPHGLPERRSPTYYLDPRYAVIGHILEADKGDTVTLAGHEADLVLDLLAGSGQMRLFGREIVID